MRPLLIALPVACIIHMGRKKRVVLQTEEND